MLGYHGRYYRIDLSRGALVEDIVYTIALTAIQADGADAAGAGAPIESATRTALNG